jgi:lipopolysaccharide/colanic/teichoic acid biosynthesis glycosyltransferase
MLIIAVLIKLSSPGPVLYTQPRVGLDRRRPGKHRWVERRQVDSGGRPLMVYDFRSQRVGPNRRRPGEYRWVERRKVDHGGRIFTIYKFRSMRADSTAPTLQVWAQPDDERGTTLGRLLRGYRVDELPQLFNVLKGDMNLIGPRPEQPMIFAELREKIDNYPQRQLVLPGITGWAQVNHGYDRDIEGARRKVQYDLEYVRTGTLTTDLRILFRTVPTVVFKRGAW